MKKLCRVCNNYKDKFAFDKNRRVCKKCRNNQIYKSFKSNLISIEKNRERSRISSKIRNKKLSKEYLRERARKYREKHRKEYNSYLRDYQKEYRKREYVKIKNTKRAVKYQKEKRKKDIIYNFRLNLSKRIRFLLKQQNTPKTICTPILLGCSIEELKQHLQQTALQNGYLDFDINNYSGKEYHIDHIIPCSAFNLKCNFHQKLCFHWSNLQILTAKENLYKGEKF